MNSLLTPKKMGEAFWEKGVHVYKGANIADGIRSLAKAQDTKTRQAMYDEIMKYADVWGWINMPCDDLEELIKEGDSE